MFKITFIDSVKKSKQYWHIEEYETTYIFGRNCLNYFSSIGIKKKECYVDIYSDVDTAISKDQIYATLNKDNILEIKFKNKLKTFFADRECSKTDHLKYDYYYLEARKSEKLKFKADKNRYIIRVEYDRNIKTTDNQHDMTELDNKHNELENSDSLVFRKSFSIDKLASASLNPNEILKNDEIAEDVSKENILESINIFAESEKIVNKALSDDKLGISNMKKETKNKEGLVTKPKGKPGRKPNSTATAALAKKEKQRATVNSLMNTLYEAQKKNNQINKHDDINDKENNTFEDYENQIKTKNFSLSHNNEDTKSSSLKHNVRISSVNYKRFKKRKLGDIESNHNGGSNLNQPKLTMKKYIDHKIPKFQTMKDLVVDTRYMSVETKEKLKEARAFIGTRKKPSETKHLFLDD